MTTVQPANIYLDFLSALNSIQIRYAVLHGWDALSRGAVSDVDIIISTQDFARLERFLCDRYRVLNALQYEATGFGFVLAACGLDLNSVFVVDASTDYRCRGCILLGGAQLLAGRRLEQGYWRVAEEQEFAYLLIKKIYEKGILPGHQRIRLGRLAADLGPCAARVLSPLFGQSEATWLCDRICAHNWAEIESRIQALQRILRFRVLKNDFLNPFRYWLADMRRVMKRWRYPTGVRIGIFGNDTGARQTIINSLRDDFHKAFRRVKVVGVVPHARAVGRLLSLKLRCDAVRSTLVILESDLQLARIGSTSIGSPDLVFTIGGSLSGQPVDAAELRRQERLFTFDEHTPFQETADSISRILSEFLVRRYKERQHVYVPSEA